jgi:hypothetical protein
LKEEIRLKSRWSSLIIEIKKDNCSLRNIEKLTYLIEIYDEISISDSLKVPFIAIQAI